MLKLNKLGEFENSGEVIEQAEYRGDTQMRSEALLNSSQIEKVYSEAPQLAANLLKQVQRQAELNREKKNLDAYRERVFNEQHIRRQIMKETRKNNPENYIKAIEQMNWQPNDIQTIKDLNYQGTKYFSGPRLTAKPSRVSDLRSSTSSAGLAGGNFIPSYDFERMKLDVEFGNGEQGELVLLPDLETKVLDTEYIKPEDSQQAIAGYLAGRTRNMSGWFDDLVDKAKEGLTEGAQDRITDEMYNLVNPEQPAPQMPPVPVTKYVPGTTNAISTSKPLDTRMLMIGAGVFGVALLGIMLMKSRPVIVSGK